MKYKLWQLRLLIYAMIKLRYWSVAKAFGFNYDFKDYFDEDYTPKETFYSELQYWYD